MTGLKNNNCKKPVFQKVGLKDKIIKMTMKAPYSDILTIFRHTINLKPTNWTVHWLGRVYSTGSACVDYVFRWGYPHLYNPLLVSGGEALRGFVDKTDIPRNIIGTTPGTCLGTTPGTCLGTTPELEFGHCGASGGSTPTSFAVESIFH